MNSKHSHKLLNLVNILNTDMSISKKTHTYTHMLNLFTMILFE